MEPLEEEEEDEGFVSIGSAFEYLETDEDIVKAKEKKEKEFYVLDKQGRRRFHGAFTGGFSAGYFNSVGTKEGWSPAPFVSSRSEKASKLQQKPEDFMDDEDLDGFGIAPRLVSTKEKFTQEKVPEVSRKRPSVIPGDPLLHTLVLPAKSTIGAKLMRAMGWREGKGVGPAVADVKLKVYGCSLPGRNSTAHVEVAPSDITSWDFNAKDNVHGIGYSGMNREHFVTSRYNKGVYGMSGQAFGVGALEEDDDDIFSQESVTSYHTSLTLPSDNDQSAKYGWTGGKDMGESWSLSSFIKSSTRQKYSKTYAPPTVPRDFVTVHKFISSSSSKSTDEKPALSVTERGYLTGDKSVFDLVSPHDRARLKRVKEGKTFPIDTHKPYVGDRSRHQEGHREGSKPNTVSGPVPSDNRLTEWEKQKEEFDRLTQVYKPLATALSDRFTKGSGQDYVVESVVKDVNPADVEMFGLMTREISEWHPHRVLCKRFNIPDPYPNSDVVGVPQRSRSSLDWRQQMMFKRTSPKDPPPPADHITTPHYTQEQKEMEVESTALEEEKSTDEQEESIIPEVEEEEEESRPVTLLKSIFEDSSSEEDEGEGGGRGDQEEQMQHDQSNVDQPHPQRLILGGHTQPQKTDVGRQNFKMLKSDWPHPHESTVVRSPDPRDKQWKNLADVVRPTLSSPQKLEQPIVYVKETFGPALPPPSIIEDSSENASHQDKQHDKNRQHHHGDNVHVHHHCKDDHYHHHKVKRKHHHKHHH